MSDAKRSIVGYVVVLFVIFGVISWGTSAVAQETATGFVPITVDNVSQLELGYALPGWCGGFSPDGTLLIAENTVYDVYTGQLRFSTGATTRTHTFSNDGMLLAAHEDGVYDVTTGERFFQTPTGLISQFIGLSLHPDNTMVAVSGYGVRAIPSGDEIFIFPEHVYSVFSPDGQWLALMGDGVYRVGTWERVFTFAERYFVPVFSPDSSLLALSYDAVYETSTWEERFSLRVDDSGSYPDPFFSPNSNLLVMGNRIYDTSSGEQVFQFTTRGYYGVAFSPNSNFLAIYDDAIYATQTWAHRFDVSGSVTFSPDETMYSVKGDGIYRTDTGAKLFAYDGVFNSDATVLVRLPDASSGFSNTCLVFGSPENEWAFRSGLVRADSPINVRSAPDGDLSSLTITGEIAVFARTPDANWFRVSPGGWVSASVVQIIAMPDGVPVENP